ncbi:homeobox-leucine zipper protein HAT22-like [Gossypium australe]|uniref:Homeobox-leucine zipper protein HAT22-like n=1 Tax=Gossypium australe TaxID=47621 RepID=A0A5B6WV63_9ROSI|nr:homeobox-leucine zipper protein HAT22-like [Gossypium australe]
MGFDDICNTALGLGLGCLVKQENISQLDHHQQKKKQLFLKHDHFSPALLSLAPSSDTCAIIDAHQQQASSLSAASSFSNSCVKREKDLGGEEVELERICSRVSDEDDEGSPRKKLRLTRQQSSILEDKFKQHSTLSPKQKQALAEELNLRPRQVEVWFQNRRARTKLKQTEVNCELLKKCYETLMEENKRLQKEVEELKSLKVTAPCYMQVGAATLTMCPSCERVDNVGENPSTTLFTLGQKSHFITPFTHPSAAC